MFHKTLMDTDHLTVQLMRDLIYRNNDVDYIALPGQAFPIFDIDKGVSRHPVSLWVYTAVANQAGKFFMDNGHFIHPGSLTLSSQSNAPRHLNTLGAPGGVRISRVTTGLPGLSSFRSIDSLKPGIEFHPMEGWDFVQMAGRCTGITTTGRRFMPYIYIENNCVADKLFHDSCKYDMWIPTKGWFGMGKEKMEMREMIRTDIPVMLTALENLIPILGYKDNVDSMTALYLSMIYSFAATTKADKLYIGPEMVNSDPAPDLLTRDEYDGIGATACADRPTITREFDKQNIWKPFEEDWFKLKEALDNHSFINDHARALTPMW